MSGGLIAKARPSGWGSGGEDREMNERLSLSIQGCVAAVLRLLTPIPGCTTGTLVLHPTSAWTTASWRTGTKCGQSHSPCKPRAQHHPHQALCTRPRLKITLGTQESHHAQGHDMGPGTEEHTALAPAVCQALHTSHIAATLSYEGTEAEKRQETCPRAHG